MTPLTPEELVIARQARTIANLRRSYTQLYTGFRHFFGESMSLRSWVLLYATCYDDETRAEIDAHLEHEHLALWRELQHWRNGTGRDT